jgi:hypothetical protein
MNIAVISILKRKSIKRFAIKANLLCPGESVSRILCLYDHLSSSSITLGVMRTTFDGISR